MCWSPDGKWVATAGWDKTARIWDARTGTETLTLKGHTRGVTTVCWSPDRDRIATASDDGTARIWDARTGAEALTFVGHTGGVKSVCWSPEGDRIATASDDKIAQDLGREDPDRGSQAQGTDR